MKTVFITFSADAWLSSASKQILSVCNSKDAAIDLLTPLVKKQSKDSYKDNGYDTWTQQYSDCVGSLYQINQTQSFTENYMIEEMEINKLYNI